MRQHKSPLLNVNNESSKERKYSRILILQAVSALLLRSRNFYSPSHPLIWRKLRSLLPFPAFFRTEAVGRGCAMKSLETSYLSLTEISNHVGVEGTQLYSSVDSDFKKLHEALALYLTSEQVAECERAYSFGAAAHEGQKRKSGEPYIVHPLAVTRILAEMRLDPACLIAALLHDVIEDTPIARDQLAKQFGEKIAELVDGVSKLTKVNGKSRAETQAASIQKMLLAMTKDIRVILIKLADRLHNMRTLEAMNEEARQRISRETLDIFAPIAHRLGIHRIQAELEELGFKYCWPWRWKAIRNALRKITHKHVNIFDTVDISLKRVLLQGDISGVVEGRQKNLYGIYRKMQKKSRKLVDLTDLFAFRIIVDKVDTCYRVLGLVHNLYKPVPGRFKDYIAIPKINGYQALHTILVGPNGIHIEIQIRTESMHRLAETGVAAHWTYKIGYSAHLNPLTIVPELSGWLSSLLDFQRQAGNSLEFLEHVKIDLFPEEVYVFTPKGLILTLKRGATVVDFAYAVHSNVGSRCVGAYINEQFAPLDTVLRNGQTVRIITGPTVNPNPYWLKFVVTSRARANIRSYLKNLPQHELITLGLRLLDSELQSQGITFAQLDQHQINKYLAEMKLTSQEELFSEIGLGNYFTSLVVRRLTRSINNYSKNIELKKNILCNSAIRGVEGMVVNFARCCRPIPGDEIRALCTPGRGISVHRNKCHNLNFSEHGGYQCFEVAWAEKIEGEGAFPTEIRVEIGNRIGALAIIAGVVAEQGFNIEHIQSQEKDGMTSILEFQILIQHRILLARLFRRLRKVSLVTRVMRITHS